MTTSRIRRAITTARCIRLSAAWSCRVGQPRIGWVGLSRLSWVGLSRIGLPGSFDEQRKRYPERRELGALQLKGPFADDRLARLGFAVSEQ